MYRNGVVDFKRDRRRFKYDGSAIDVNGVGIKSASGLECSLGGEYIAGSYRPCPPEKTYLHGHFLLALLNCFLAKRRKESLALLLQRRLDHFNSERHLASAFDSGLDIGNAFRSPSHSLGIA